MPLYLHELYEGLLRKEEEYWIANNVLRPLLADILGLCQDVSLLKLKRPHYPPGCGKNRGE